MNEIMSLREYCRGTSLVVEREEKDVRIKEEEAYRAQITEENNREGGNRNVCSLLCVVQCSLESHFRAPKQLNPALRLITAGNQSTLLDS
jgi:hypothetical protein